MDSWLPKVPIFFNHIESNIQCLQQVHVKLRWDAKITHSHNYVPPPLGRGGASRFTLVSRHPNVRLRPSASVCAKLCLCDISYSFSPMAFKLSDMVTMDKTFDWLTFHDYGSIFKVTGHHYVSKLTLFTWYFQQFSTNGFQILTYMVTMDKTLNLLMFCEWPNFQGHRGHVSKLTFFSCNISCSFVLMGFN